MNDSNFKFVQINMKHLLYKGFSKGFYACKGGGGGRGQGRGEDV